MPRAANIGEGIEREGISEDLSYEID